MNRYHQTRLLTAGGAAATFPIASSPPVVGTFGNGTAQLTGDFSPVNWGGAVAGRMNVVWYSFKSTVLGGWTSTPANGFAWLQTPQLVQAATNSYFGVGYYVYSAGNPTAGFTGTNSVVGGQCEFPVNGWQTPVLDKSIAVVAAAGTYPSTVGDFTFSAGSIQVDSAPGPTVMTNYTEVLCIGLTDETGVISNTGSYWGGVDFSGTLTGNDSGKGIAWKTGASTTPRSVGLTTVGGGLYGVAACTVIVPGPS